MNLLTLASRGLRHYRRTHAGVVAGCAISAAVLCGALFVGDSVRGTLRGIALARLGRFDVALDSGNRFFRSDLASRLPGSMAAALRLPGMAIREGKDRRQVNRVEVYGIDAGFLGIPIPPGRVVLNAKLAAALGVKAGDEVDLRVFKPGLLARDAPLSSKKADDRDTRRMPLTVEAVLPDDGLGRFSLKSDQAVPYNAFLPLKDLQGTLEMEGRANLLAGSRVEAESVQAELKRVLLFEDAGLVLRPASGLLQLQSRRIYLDPGTARRAMALRPGAVGVLSYMVDSIAAEGGASTPYSFMTALSPGDRALGPVPAGMKDDEILVNHWLADRISVKDGETVTVTYSEFTANGKFAPRRRSFRVRSILGMEELGRERELVPEFPGLTDVESCKNWRVGIPMDEEKLKDPANEEYWKQYKQTPKAFVTLQAGREMWANRYGDLMAVRYAAEEPKKLGEEIRAAVDPAEAGLVFRPVRAQALAAASESMDLGQLFLGMSLFLIAASLILTAMLFVFSVEQRAREMGVLRAAGFTPGAVRRLFLSEGFALASAGSLAGIPLGWAFAKALLWGLGSAWSGAVAGTPIAFHAAPASAAIGAGAAAAMSLVAMAAALWRQSKRPVRELVSEDFSLSLEQRSPGKGWGRWLVLVAGLLGALAIAAATVVSGAERPAGAFFGAGALTLAGGMALVRILLARRSGSTAKLTVRELGSRNAARRPGRGMATAGMLACGCFIVFSVSAFKEDLSLHAGARRSGTGGFGLYGESSVAIHQDLDGAKERKELFLTDDTLMGDVTFVPVRVRDGDDASCLNLNQSAAPPLLGVDPSSLGRRGAFAPADLWALLDEVRADGAVPALVGDAATAVWKLRKSVGRETGDVIDYRDERGTPFKVKLVGALPDRLTVFQGRLIVANRHFTRLFPSEGGDRVFLVDLPPGKVERVRAYLAEKLAGWGLEIVSPVDRLKEFYAVESAYLTLFLALGGLGLLLGSAGMGVLVLRHVLERRAELALLRAVGYTERQAGSVVMAEHLFLLAAGLAAGTAAAALAIAPAVARPEIHLPYGLLAVFLVGTAILSLLWIRLAASFALRSPLIGALRNE
jgi:putative ABC transport system permease protein